VISQDTVGVLF